jgi:hypothetical protein
MYRQEIPRDITIEADNILGNTEGDNVCVPVKDQPAGSKRALLELEYGGDVFGRGFARFTFFEPAGTSMLINPSVNQGFTGRWIIRVGLNTKFIGYMTNVETQRLQGGSIRTYTLTDVLQGWDVLLTNMVYPKTSNNSYTVSNLLSDLVNDVTSISDISLHGNVPQNSTLLTDLFEEGKYVITNSTYLAEIQKIAQMLGYVVFCDIGFGDVTIADPFNFNRGILGFNLNSVIDASYEVDYLKMASTVLVNDDVSLKGVAYGHMGTGSNKDDSVYNASRINNLVFATVFGVKEIQLSAIAQKLFNIGKNQSRVLTIKKAGDEFSSHALGSDILWAGSYYTVFSYTTRITPREYTTTYKAFKKV